MGVPVTMMRIVVLKSKSDEKSAVLVFFSLCASSHTIRPSGWPRSMSLLSLAVSYEMSSSRGCVFATKFWRFCDRSSESDECSEHAVGTARMWCRSPRTCG